MKNYKTALIVLFLLLAWFSTRRRLRPDVTSTIRYDWPPDDYTTGLGALGPPSPAAPFSGLPPPPVAVPEPDPSGREPYGRFLPPDQ